MGVSHSRNSINHTMMEEEHTTKPKTHDEDIRRATYTLEYPTSTRQLKDKFDYTKEFRPSATGGYKYITHRENINISYTLGTIKDCEFKQSRFYIDEQKKKKITKLTFRNCHFSNCFLGTSIYIEIKFENCIFSSCDFMHAQFIKCTFDKSSFNDCTAQNCYFENSEIDSTIFLLSLERDKNKLCGLGVKQNDIEKLYRQTKHSNYDIAKIIYKSNITVGNSNLIDKSLYSYKKLEIAYLCDLFRHTSSDPGSAREGFIRSLWVRKKYIMPIIGRCLNMILTRGGTSLFRLIIIALISILIFNFYFSISKITNTVFDVPKSNHNNFPYSYLSWLPTTISDFLGFGYTAFKASNFKESIELITCATLGLFWYALLIPILIRKIYR